MFNVNDEHFLFNNAHFLLNFLILNKIFVKLFVQDIL